MLIPYLSTWLVGALDGYSLTHCVSPSLAAGTITLSTVLTILSSGAEGMEIVQKRPLANGLGLACVFSAVFGLGTLVGSAIRLVVDEVALEKDEPKEDRRDL
jgi:hypothetical protein